VFKKLTIYAKFDPEGYLIFVKELHNACDKQFLLKLFAVDA
jgi:hypothetical protein